MFETQDIGSPIGDMLKNVKVRAVNRHATDVAVGDVMALDIGATETDTQNGNGADGRTNLPIENAVFQNLIQYEGAGLLVSSCPVVVTSLLDGTGAQGQTVEVAIAGYVAEVKFGGTIAVGDKLQVDHATPNDRELIRLTAGAGISCVGTALTASGGSFIKVLFNGFAGMFGGDNA